MLTPRITVMVTENGVNKSLIIPFEELESPDRERLVEFLQELHPQNTKTLRSMFKMVQQIKDLS